MNPGIVDLISSVAAENRVRRAPQADVFQATGDQVQDAQIRAKIQCGLSPKMAAEVVKKDNAERCYLKMSDRDGMIGLLLKIKPLRDELAHLQSQNWRTDAEGAHAGMIRQEFEPLLKVAAELAERIFKPILESTREGARDEVREIAGGDEKRISALIEHHWRVVRLREFLYYVDSLGNSEVNRSDLFIEFFEAEIKAIDTAAKQPGGSSV